MYVRDELGVFPECAYSLLLSISFLLTHREAVTGYPAGHRLASFYPTPCILDAKRAVCLSPLWGRRTVCLLGSEIDQYWSVVGAVLVTLRSSTGH